MKIASFAAWFSVCVNSSHRLSTKNVCFIIGIVSFILDNNQGVSIKMWINIFPWNFSSEPESSTISMKILIMAIKMFTIDMDTDSIDQMLKFINQRNHESSSSSSTARGYHVMRQSTKQQSPKPTIRLRRQSLPLSLPFIAFFPSLLFIMMMIVVVNSEGMYISICNNY